MRVRVARCIAVVMVAFSLMVSVSVGSAMGPQIEPSDGEGGAGFIQRFSHDVLTLGDGAPCSGHMVGRTYVGFLP